MAESYQAIRMKEKRRAAKDEGMCGLCFKRLAMPGETRCGACADAQDEYKTSRRQEVAHA